MEQLCRKLADHIEGRDLEQVESHLTELWDTFLIADPILGETDASYKSELLMDVLWLKQLITILDKEERDKLTLMTLRKVI